MNFFGTWKTIIWNKVLFQNVTVVNSPQELLNGHKQAEHQSVRVDIDARDQVDIICDQCDYQCRLNIQLKKHINVHHKQKEEEQPQDNSEMKFNCETCPFASHYVLHMWEHRQSDHPEQVPQFFPKSKDMVLALLAEQGYDIIFEIEALKKRCERLPCRAH